MNDREKFYSVVNQFTFLIPLWDQEHHEIKLDLLETQVTVMSSGERHITLFMANVWFNYERYPFDMLKAASVLSGRYKRVLVEWVTDPYWP